MTKSYKGLTLKQENASQAFIENGGNKSASYRAAYNTQNMADNTVYRKAHELFSNGKVTARIKELMLEHRRRHNISVDQLTDELDQSRELARQLGLPSAMNQATMAKAKLHGLLVDKQEHTGKDGIQLDTNWKVTIMK